MNIQIENLQKSMLFKNMSEAEIKKMLLVLPHHQTEFLKDQFIFNAGDTTDSIALVISGSVTVENNDYWGNRTILNYIKQNQFFAETYAILQKANLLVDVRANENCKIFFINILPLYNSSSKSNSLKNEDWVLTFTKNLLRITANKNLALSQRSFVTAQKSAQKRILTYLHFVSVETSSREFDIPFDRQQMADYLNLERTVLSKELSLMQKNGFIEFKKNHFKILNL